MMIFLGYRAEACGISWQQDSKAALSKYPPAKPGALLCEPLKAA
jgi:hypothetical protein